MAELISIGDLARETGIGIDTLRVWERRYGRPRPVRLPSGHRRYTPEHVRWARRVAEALKTGLKASKAVKATEEELNGLLGRAGSPAAVEDLGSLFALVRDYRDEELLARLWEDWRRLGPEDFLVRRLDPLIVAVGRGWAAGDLDVRHEHFLTEVVEHFLRTARLAITEELRGPGLLLATLAGEEHGLGLQMAALVCARHGVRARILGTSVPSVELVRAAAETGAEALGISVSLATGGVDTDRALARLREALPAGVGLVVGGAGARGARRGPRGIAYVADLTEFGAWIDRLRA